METFFSHDGVLYRFIGDIAQRHNECELIAYPNMHAKYYQIPDEIEYYHRKRKVIGISKFAFKDCDNIETLYIPKSVKYIGLNAFSDVIICELCIISDSKRT